ncbi:hypothetical protein FOXYS1_13608 [Fusarium oxysporum]|uniref:CHAT domain-containing protein n=1 Tax=Fusarium oxysporum TaxID=5507 RepID=A0A8H5ED29_FUSOX|nr:hypothetical protein FOXYS1_13608 [Fusarium oxysporum]
MDFLSISMFFGGCVLPEDIRVDLQKSHQALREDIEDDRHHMILQVVLLSLCGNLQTAFRLLDDLEYKAQVAKDEDLLVRIPTYRLHLQRIKMAPPPLFFWSDRNVSTRIHQNGRDCRTSVRDFHKSLETLQNKVDTHFKRYPLPRIQSLESRTLLKMWPLVHYTWNGAFLRHPKYQTSTSHLSRYIVSDGMGEYDSRLVGDAMWRGLPDTAFIMELLTARKKKATGKLVPYLDSDPDAKVLESPSRQAFRLLVIGDFQFSEKPFTNPLALNMMLYADGMGWNDREWDRMEKRTLCSPEAELQATKTYKKAFDLFRSVQCMRGMAAIHLRLGCISMMKAIDQFGAKSGGGIPKSSHSLLNEAANEFDMATPLFRMDETHLCIVDAHRLLCRIIQQYDGIKTEDIEAAHRLGRWGADRGNPRPSIFSGMLFLRTGRRLSKFVQQAWKCCICARVIFAALGDFPLEAKAVEAQAMYYHATGNFELAKRHLQVNRKVIIGSLTQVEMIIQTCDTIQEQLRQPRFRQDYGKNPKHLTEIFNVSKEALFWHSSFFSVYSDEVSASKYAEDVRGACAETRKQLLWQQERRRISIHKFTNDIFGINVEAKKWIDSVLSYSKQSQSQDEIHEDTKPLSGTDPLAQLENWVEKLCVTVGCQNEFDRQASQKHALKMKRFYDAVRVMNRAKAAEILDEEFLHQHIIEQSRSNAQANVPVPGISIAAGTRIVALCYRSQFEEAQRELSASLPLVGVLRFPFGQPDMRVKFLHMQAKVYLWLCYITRSWERGRAVLEDLGRVMVEIGQKEDTFFEELKNNPDVDRWMAMVAIGWIQYHAKDMKSAIHWYGEAYSVVERNRINIPDIQSRRIGGSLLSPLDAYVGLTKVILSICSDGGEEKTRFQAYGLEMLGLDRDISPKKLQGIDLAVLFFEKGKARVLADMMLLHENKANLQTWIQFRATMRNIGGGKSGSSHPPGVFECAPSILDIAEQAFKDQEVLRYISLLQQEPAALHNLAKANDAYRCIPDNTVVVHVNTDPEETIILYMTSQGIQFVHRASLKSHELNMIVLQYLDMIRRQELSGNYHSLAERLSEHIIWPASTILKTIGNIVFVPSKSLHNFPVSVLTLDGAALCESKSIYFCPSLQTLSQLASRVRAFETEASQKLTSSGFVTFMAPSKDIAQSAQSQPSVAAGFAIKHAEDLLYKVVPANRLDNVELLSEIRTASVNLISSHGNVNAQTPWNNNLSLHDAFSVTEMLESTSNAMIIIFQACLSSLSGLDDGDDVIGFSHAVLSSGANNFIGALWEVNELAASLLISYLMDQIKVSNASITISDALRHAQTKLRRTTHRQVVERLHAVRQVVSRAQARKQFAEYNINLGKVDRILRTRMSEFELQPELEYPYDHPYYWGPFVLVGYGHMIL